MEQQCTNCKKIIGPERYAFLLTSSQYAPYMKDAPEFGWSDHFKPVRAWCDECGSKLWSWSWGGKCKFCEKEFTAGDEVFWLVTGALPPLGYLALQDRRLRFVAHKQCLKRRPEFSN